MVEEKTSKKKQLILAGVGLAFLLVLVIGATYAYFQFTSQNEFRDPATIEGSMGALGGVSLTKAEDSTLTLNLSAADMLLENAGTYYASGSSTPKTIATVKAAGGGRFNCTYTLEVTKTSKSAETDMYERFQSSEYINKSANQIWFTVNDTTYDFNTAGLFDENGKLTYSGTLSMISNAEDIDLTANMAIVNLSDKDQTYLNGTDVSISINAKTFNCELVELSEKLSERIIQFATTSSVDNIKSFTVPDYANAITVTDATYETFTGVLSSTSGTTVDNAFTYSNGTYTSVPENLTTNTLYHVKITIPSDGYYQVCYSLPSKDGYHDKNTMYIFKNKNYFNFNLYDSEQKGCYDLGFVNTNEYIKVVQYAYTTIAPISFYLERTEKIKEIYPGYRYQGLTPDNYITFNGETWRVIGTEEGSSIGLENGKYYTKIIREDYYFLPYVSDSDFHEWDWSKTSLYRVLNGDYYNRVNDYAETGLTEDTKNLIVDANWYYTPIGDEFLAGDCFTPKNFFDKERANATKVVKSPVGIMYPSDYGFASPTKECEKVALVDYVLNDDFCHLHNWLYSSEYEQWTITPASEALRAFYVHRDGYVDVIGTRLNIYRSNDVRPTVYLDTDVIITSGNGSETNPYQIAKPTN